MSTQQATAIVLAAVLALSRVAAADEPSSEGQISITIEGETLGELLGKLHAEYDYAFMYPAGDFGNRRGPHILIEPTAPSRAWNILAAAYHACVVELEPTGDRVRSIVYFTTCDEAERFLRRSVGQEAEPPKVALGLVVHNGNSEGISGTGVRGALVTQVHPELPAYKAGVREGDVIVSYDGEPVSGMRHLVELVRRSQPGEIAQLVIVRGLEQFTLSVQY